MAANNVIEFDPLTVILFLIILVIVGYIGLRLWRIATKTNKLSEKRGFVKSFLDFNRLPTVPTIRLISRGDHVCMELGKRAKLRDNSLVDSMDKKGWDITSDPIPIMDGDRLELGYITHPAGCTLNIKPHVKQIRADEMGNPVYLTAQKVDETGALVFDKDGKPVMIQKPDYIEANFEGVIGIQSDLDDFNESTERVISSAWVLPLIIGIIAGVVFFAPIAAWLMSYIAGMGR
jgi:hypothetical protein